MFQQTCHIIIYIQVFFFFFYLHVSVFVPLWQNTSAEIVFQNVKMVFCQAVNYKKCNNVNRQNKV